MSNPVPHPASVVHVVRALTPGGSRRIVQRGTVIAVDDDRDRFTVRLDEGDVITLDPAEQGRVWGVAEWARRHGPRRRIIATSEHTHKRLSGRFSEHNPERYRSRFGHSPARATRAEAIADAQRWFDQIDSHVDADIVDALTDGTISADTANRIAQQRAAAARALNGE